MLFSFGPLSPPLRLLQWGNGEKTGKLKNRGRAGDDGKGQTEGASALQCFQNGARFPRESGSRSTSHNMAAETQHVVRQQRILFSLSKGPFQRAKPNS